MLFLKIAKYQEVKTLSMKEEGRRKKEEVFYLQTSSIPEFKTPTPMRCQF
ncbi:MAG: hypothetical protein KME60_02930 [Cyanomargarita calcarea GSE-NOS-MK-12-04C]|uniref:Uncharacterized protein n=1 Tax=Cyanomargarita calcarea GSE-NOS-MK-12-04C TaxID=2839659 RepID=A0A951QIB4_9CYAN|nr:hypothetical protein [Cyanomargarita calcarea GSE-NOS-MK-12-04C]